MEYMKAELREIMDRIRNSNGHLIENSKHQELERCNI